MSKKDRILILRRKEASDISNAQHPYRKLAIEILEHFLGDFNLGRKLKGEKWFEMEDKVTDLINRSALQMATLDQQPKDKVVVVISKGRMSDILSSSKKIQYELCDLDEDDANNTRVKEVRYQTLKRVMVSIY